MLPHNIICADMFIDVLGQQLGNPSLWLPFLWQPNNPEMGPALILSELVLSAPVRVVCVALLRMALRRLRTTSEVNGAQTKMGLGNVRDLLCSIASANQGCALILLSAIPSMRQQSKYLHTMCLSMCLPICMYTSLVVLIFRSLVQPCCRLGGIQVYRYTCRLMHLHVLLLFARASDRVHVRTTARRSTHTHIDQYLAFRTTTIDPTQKSGHFGMLSAIVLVQ